MIFFSCRVILFYSCLFEHEKKDKLVKTLRTTGCVEKTQSP